MISYTIPNLRNACRTMEYIGKTSRALSCIELAKALGIPRTTEFRILKTLEEESFVSRDESGRYSLGISLSNLGDCSFARTNILNFAPQYLVELTATTGETSHLGIQSDTKVLIAKVCESPLPLHATSRAGAIVDMHCSGTGKAILAQLCNCSPEFIKRLKLQKHTRHTITSAQELAKEMKTIFKRGYALDNEEYHEGVRCLAVPVFDKFGACVGAVGITAPAVRFSKKNNETIYSAVATTARELESKLGTIK